jgi:hypothetical protein
MCAPHPGMGCHPLEGGVRWTPSGIAGHRPSIRRPASLHPPAPATFVGQPVAPRRALGMACCASAPWRWRHHPRQAAPPAAARGQARRQRLGLRRGESCMRTPTRQTRSWARRIEHAARGAGQPWVAPRCPSGTRSGPGVRRSRQRQAAARQDRRARRSTVQAEAKRLYSAALRASQRARTDTRGLGIPQRRFYQDKELSRSIEARTNAGDTVVRRQWEAGDRHETDARRRRCGTAPSGASSHSP